MRQHINKIPETICNRSSDNKEDSKIMGTPNDSPIIPMQRSNKILFRCDFIRIVTQLIRIWRTRSHADYVNDVTIHVMRCVDTIICIYYFVCLFGMCFLYSSYLMRTIYHTYSQETQIVRLSLFRSNWGCLKVFFYCCVAVIVYTSEFGEKKEREELYHTTKTKRKKASNEQS